MIIMMGNEVCIPSLANPVPTSYDTREILRETRQLLQILQLELLIEDLRIFPVADLPSYTSSPESLCPQCCFKFEKFQLPSFNISEVMMTHEANPILNENNPIIFSNGSLLNSEMNCNGNNISYQLDDGTWISSYIDGNGSRQSLDNLFYARGHNIYFRKPENDGTRLLNLLRERLVRMLFKCDNVIFSCIEFYIENEFSKKSKISEIQLDQCLQRMLDF